MIPNMENPTNIKVEVHVNSFVETFINEFSGIPGIKIEVLSPTRYKLIDCTAKDSFCESILLDRYNGYWHFKQFSNISKTFESFYAVRDCNHRTNTNYVKNTILIDMLRALFKLSSQILPNNS